MENQLIKILYIDDEKAALFNFELLFHDDYEVYTAISAAKGMGILATTDIQIIVSDQRMPDKTGIEFFAEVTELYPDTFRILLTAYSEAPDIIDAINQGQVYQYITKPFEKLNVKNILDKATQNWRLKKENDILIAQLQNKKEEYEAINEELRQTNEELYAGEKRIVDLAERLSLSQEVSSAGTWDWNIQTNTFYWSEEFLKLFGMEPGTVPGFESWTKSLHPDDIEAASKRIQDAITEKTDLLQFYRIVLPDGNLRWIRAMGKVTYQNDIPIRMIGLCIDVTDQKLSEEILLGAKTDLELAQSLAHIGSWKWNITTGLVEWSDEMFKIFGVDKTDNSVSLDQIIAKSIHPEDRQRVKDNQIAIMKGATSLPIEYRVIRADGAVRYIWADGGILEKDESGNPAFLRGILQDKTERKKSEDGLRANEAKFMAVAEFSPLAIYASSGSEQKGIYINEAFYKIFGFSMEDVPTVGEWWIKAFPDVKYRQQVINQWVYNIEQADKNNTDVEVLECTCTCKDGSEKIIAWVGKTIGEEFWAFGYDFTERKQAEIILRTEKERIRTILDLVGDPIFVKDNDHRITLANRAFYEMFGKDEKSVIGFTLVEAVPENERHHFLQVDRMVLDTGIANMQEEELTVGGLTRSIITRKTRFTDESGNKFLVGSIHDVTERKRVEEKLSRSEKELKKAQQITHIGSWYLDVATNEVVWTDELYKMYGFDPALPPPPFTEHQNLFTPESWDLLSSSLANTIDTGIPYEIELKTVKDDGGNGWMWARGETVKDPEGKTIGLWGAAQDITDRKQSEDALLKSRLSLQEALKVSDQSRKSLLSVLEDQRRTQQEINVLNAELEQRVIERTAQLEAANKELEAFSYSVSHDLRAPLRHISGFISLFMENKPAQLTKEEIGYLNIVVQSSEEMGKLIDALLTFSRLNRTELYKVRIDTSQLINKGLHLFEPEIKARGIEINIGPLPDSFADQQLLSQVWINLLSNAIKYTGKKEKAVIEIGSFTENDETVFYIKDNGAGFNMKYADKLFMVFQRLHKPRDFEGIGIGLANINRIVTRHGGRCRAEGVVDNGATFYFSLPDGI